MNKKYAIVIIILCSIGICAGMIVFYILNLRSELHQITGTVTTKFTDCVGSEVMDTNGKISKIDRVPCDGGSKIIIDYDKTFITQTGNVPQNEAYNIDVSSIQVGDKVTVRYIVDQEGYETLKCDACSVTKQ